MVEQFLGKRLCSEQLTVMQHGNVHCACSTVLLQHFIDRYPLINPHKIKLCGWKSFLMNRQKKNFISLHYVLLLWMQLLYLDHLQPPPKPINVPPPMLKDVIARFSTLSKLPLNLCLFFSQAYCTLAFNQPKIMSLPIFCIQTHNS